MEEAEEENYSQADCSSKNVDNINMKKSCRICLSQFDLGISLFEPDETLYNATAASLVWNCFGIKIYERDELPSQICNECAMNILISHNFKIQLQQSHKLLQSKFPSKQQPSGDIYEKPLCITKIEENLYRISADNAGLQGGANEKDIKNYKNLIHNLKIDKKIKLEKDTEILLITDKPTDVQSPLELKESEEQISIMNTPKSMTEASKWLKLAKQSGPPYTCTLCNRTYQSKYPTFYTHVRLHFTTKIQCSLCPQKYLPNRKEYHMRTHTKEKPHKCLNCSKNFSMQNHLNRHLKLCCNRKAESCCKVCQKVFPTYKLMHTHLIKEHGACQHEQIRSECVTCKKDNENKYICEYCGSKVRRYTRHLSSCKAAPITAKFQLQNATTCNECGELFFSDFQLKNHMRKHEDTKNCICNVCGRIFLQKRYLKDHMEIHEPGRYPCEKCGKIFKRRLLLKLHKHTHNDVKNHECTICNKSFRVSDHLKKHLVVHTKAKPFICNICNKSFSFKGNLNQHLLVHVKVKYFSCGICHKTFANQGNLKKHMVLHNDVSVK